jgi:hypothetical protein
MFNTISWQAYWTFLVIVLSAYYLLVLFIYYRSDLKASFLSKTFTRSGVQSFIVDNSEFEAPSAETAEGIVYTCMDEINSFFAEAKKRKWNKNEMIYSLQSILKKYPAITTSGYKQSVSNVLLNQCEHICNLHLSAEELSHVWLG